MKKNILIFVFFFVATFSCFAQIEDEIMQSKSAKISQGRVYLAEKIQDCDYDKVKEIRNYLVGLEDDRYVSLLPHEMCEIYLLTSEFDEMACYMRQSDMVQKDNKILQNADGLEETFIVQCFENEPRIRTMLRKANLPAEDYDFVSLYVDWKLRGNHGENQDELNSKSDVFLEKYPNSDYEWFVRQEIRYKEVCDDLGMNIGFDFNSGFLTGPLHEKLAPILGVGFGIEVFYKNWLFDFGVDGVMGFSKIDQEYSDGVFSAGKRVDMGVFLASVGYPIVNEKRVSLSPFLGIGCLSERYVRNRNQSYRELNRVYWDYQTGLMLDIKGGIGADRGFARIKYICGIVPINGKISTVNVISVGLFGTISSKHREY